MFAVAALCLKDVERVLADIDADHGDYGVDFRRHGALLVFGAPCQLQSLVGQERGRTIPLPDITARLATKEARCYCLDARRRAAQ
jgi:hypothetical protein